jgi:large repetitive protein
MPRIPLKPLISMTAALVVLVVLPGVAMAAQPSNYWLVSSTGQVFAYGKAKTHGSEFHKHYAGRITGIKSTPNGDGYWIVTTKKHYSFGDASHYKYRRGGLQKYKGKDDPKGLRGQIVGYAVATIPKPKSGGGGTKTTTTTTTTPAVDCGSVTIQTTSLSEPTATAAYSQTLSAGGITGGTWSWALTSGSLPSGLALSNTGVISGTPAADTTGTQSTFAVRATNSQCSSQPASRSFTLTVDIPAMSITTQSLSNGEYGETYPTQTLTAVGGQPGDYQWTATGLPNGLSLSSSGVLSGTPQTTGTFNPQITVTDTAGETPAVSASYTLTVTFPPLQITTTRLNGGQDTTTYATQTLSATGGTAVEFPPGDRAAMYVWSATRLPSGLSLSTSGVLSGTPTQSGTYSPQITVADAAGNVPSVTQTFTLNIALAPLEFTTTTLTAIEGQSFSGQVAAQGGQPPYSVSLVSGSLPTGLQLDDGAITGTPTAASGSYQFAIGVSDSQSTPATAQETFNMEIAPSEASPDISVTSSTSSSTWAGYLEQAPAAFTSVSGTFTVPSVQGTPSNSVSPWVGIDGNGTNDLIQAGVSAAGGNGTSSYEAWWETIGSIGSSQNLPPQDQFDATPGDSINVDIWQVSSGQWEITLNDTTSGQGFATTVSYSGADLTAEWIVETPSGVGATGYASTSTFSNLQTSQAGSGMLDLSTAGASPGALTASGFSISDYN